MEAEARSAALLTAAGRGSESLEALESGPHVMEGKCVPCWPALPSLLQHSVFKVDRKSVV